MKRKLNLKNNNIVIIFLRIKKHQIKLMIKLKNEKLGTLISGKMYINDKNNSFYKNIFIFRLQSKYKVGAGSGEKCKLSLQLNAARRKWTNEREPTDNVLGILRKFGPSADFLSFGRVPLGCHNPITAHSPIGNHSRAMYIKLTALITRSRFIMEN